MGVWCWGKTRCTESGNWHMISLLLIMVCGLVEACFSLLVSAY